MAFETPTIPADMFYRIIDLIHQAHDIDPNAASFLPCLIADGAKLENPSFDRRRFMNACAYTDLVLKPLTYYITTEGTVVLIEAKIGGMYPFIDSHGSTYGPQGRQDYDRPRSVDLVREATPEEVAHSFNKRFPLVD